MMTLRRFRRPRAARPRARAARRALRSRRGFTLVELIVAVIVLTVGLLGLVATSAMMVRTMGEGALSTTAATTAQGRFEKLAASSCTSMTLNTWTTVTKRGVTEKYLVRDTVGVIGTGNNVRVATDSVSFRTRLGKKTVVFKTLFPCRPGA